MVPVQPFIPQPHRTGLTHAHSLPPARRRRDSLGLACRAKSWFPGGLCAALDAGETVLRWMRERPCGAAVVCDSGLRQWVVDAPPWVAWPADGVGISRRGTTSTEV